MTSLTLEQQDRESLMIDLQKAVMIATDDELVRPSAVLWLHITYWNNGYFDMQRLLDEGCLIPEKDIPYKPDGSWLSNFAPQAYQLTEKGYKILTQKSQWVFEGTLK